MNGVWNAWLDPANKPVRFCVEVRGPAQPPLATPDSHPPNAHGRLIWPDRTYSSRCRLRLQLPKISRTTLGDHGKTHTARAPMSFFFLRSVLTSNRHQTTWFCPSAATQLRAGLRLPIGCTTIQQVPRNESCAVPRRSRGLLHPSQVRRTTNATKRHPGPRPSFVKLCRIFIWTTHVFSL